MPCTFCLSHLVIDNVAHDLLCKALIPLILRHRVSERNAWEAFNFTVADAGEECDHLFSASTKPDVCQTAYAWCGYIEVRKEVLMRFDQCDFKHSSLQALLKRNHALEGVCHL